MQISLSELNVVGYIKRYRKYTRESQDGKSPDNNFKIAILSSSTINGLKEILWVKCFEAGINVDIYIGKYNQYTQEILDINSSLYSFNPNLVILFTDTRSLMGDLIYEWSNLSQDLKKETIKNKLDELTKLILTFKLKSSAKILIHNLEVPFNSPLGILENKQMLGIIESIELLNQQLRDFFKQDSQVFIYDYDLFCNKLGKENIFDHKMYYLADIKIKLDYLPRLCGEYMSYIKAIKSKAKKCLVLDLDNTLWGGVIGEDGLKGIKLGPSPEGRPFWELQKFIISLFNRGVILAINSKNNFNDAMKVFKEHPSMLLKEEHFAAVRINWIDKVSNMKSIAKEINIGTDSLVFIDDDSANRELVKKLMPEVLVVDLPQDPALYLKTVMEINDFDILQITEEDKEKGVIYAQQRKRNEFKENIGDLMDYLKGLEMQVEITEVDNLTIVRAAQLTQKTNQFNMTINRYQEEDLKKLCSSNNFIICVIRVKDKFGDNGLTGLFIVKMESNYWEIDSFLLSCRVMGRDIEKVMLAWILEKAKAIKINKIIGKYVPTEKNVPAKDFYKNNGFQLVDNELGKEIWEYNAKKKYLPPEYIKIVLK